MGATDRVRGGEVAVRLLVVRPAHHAGAAVYQLVDPQGPGGLGGIDVGSDDAFVPKYHLDRPQGGVVLVRRLLACLACMVVQRNEADRSPRVRYLEAARRAVRRRGR